MLTAQDKQNILQVISTIPDLHDRIFLMTMMSNYHLEVAEIMHEALKPLRAKGVKW